MGYTYQKKKIMRKTIPSVKTKVKNAIARTGTTILQEDDLKQVVFALGIVFLIFFFFGVYGPFSYILPTHRSP